MPLLVILFIILPIAELYLIIQVGQAIGLLPTIAILIAGAVLGAALLRHQGRSAWRRFNLALAEKSFPGKEVADGLMITFGGALLLTPGFITDIFGLALLLPPTRAVIQRVFFALVGSRFKLVGTVGSFGYSQVRNRGSRATRSSDIDGTAHDVTDDERGDGPPRLPPS